MEVCRGDVRPAGVFTGGPGMILFLPMRAPLLVLLVIVTAACGMPGAGPRADLVVMTRNVYVGADLDAVIGALASPDTTDDGPALFAAIATLERTAFPLRAAAIADEIARARPHAVGLQEVSTLTLPLPSGVTVVDFWPILEAALAARGLRYVKVAEVTNMDLVIPPGAGLVDRDLLLVAAEVPVLASGHGRYAAGLPLGFATLTRGWAWADLDLAGRTIRVVNTHLESGGGGAGTVRRLQAEELVAGLAAVDTPVIVMGDLNDVPGSPTYQAFAAAGFTDTWDDTAGDPGFTCCHVADLSNPAPTLTARIDLILVRGGLEGGARGTLTGVRAEERVAGPAGPIWASDHAGVVARLRPAR